MIYLLDTSIVSPLMESPAGRIAARIAEVAPATIVTSVVVPAELRYGIAWRGSEKLQNRLESLLKTLVVEPLQAPVDEVYGRLRAEMRRAGCEIGANDMLIAAHAFTLGAIMVTDNVREFGRVRVCGSRIGCGTNGQPNELRARDWKHSRLPSARLEARERRCLKQQPMHAEPVVSPAERGV